MAVTPKDVAKIIAIEEPALRNLLITQSYHELAVDMQRLVGAKNSSWAAYACWASKQAGAFIRQEELPSAIRRLVFDETEAGSREPQLLERGRRVRAYHDELDASVREGANIFHVLDDVLDQISIYVGGGNRIVFEELGLLYARFIQAFDGTQERDPAAIADFIAPLAPGPSMADELAMGEDGRLAVQTRGGQSLLRAAAESLYAAVFERDASTRANLILLSNAQCGLHEQTRLQPYIVGGQQAPVSTLLRGELRRRGQSTERHGRVIEELSELVRELSTELLMSMRLPDETIHLGRDLEAAPGRPLWPPDLERLELPELIALTQKLGAYDTREANLDWTDRVEDWFDRILSTIGVGSPEAQGTGARDWASLSDRMRFIFALFRSRQQDERLLQRPFDPSQVETILAGRIPEGAL